MFNFSDILKKNKDAKTPQPVAPQSSSPVAMPSVDKVSLACVVGKDSSSVSSVDARKIYDTLVGEARKVYKPGIDLAQDYQVDVSGFIARVVEALKAGDHQLLKIALMDYPLPPDFLLYHVVNISILSCWIGVGFGFDGQRLIELGSAAFLHDIGELRYLDLIGKNRNLTKDEYRLVQNHPQAAGEILSRIGKRLSPQVIDAVLKEHERVDGSGYPSGLKDQDIGEYSKIIGFCDVYEAIVHQRPHRAKLSPMEAIKTILNNKAAFSQNVMKLFIETVGIFPLGILVKLNTHEIAVVKKMNSRLPLRPVVEILFDANGRKLSEPKEISLGDNSVIYIEECLQDFCI